MVAQVSICKNLGNYSISLEQIARSSVVTNQSISEIVNDALVASLSEDEEDLAAFEERSSEPNITYEQFLAKLKADGKI